MYHGTGGRGGLEGGLEFQLLSSGKFSSNCQRYVKYYDSLLPFLKWKLSRQSKAVMESEAEESTSNTE